MIECVQDFSIVVNPGCDCTFNWAVPGAGICRLRYTVSYFDGILTPCLGATPSALPPWDGTLPVWDGFQYLSANSANFSVSGHRFFGANCFKVGAQWLVDIAGDSFGVGNGMWLGQRIDPCPIGVYTRTGGCQPGPATFTLEGYVP